MYHRICIGKKRCLDSKYCCLGRKMKYFLCAFPPHSDTKICQNKTNFILIAVLYRHFSNPQDIVTKSPLKLTYYNRNKLKYEKSTCRKKSDLHMPKSPRLCDKIELPLKFSFCIILNATKKCKIKLLLSGEQSKIKSGQK